MRNLAPCLLAAGALLASAPAISDAAPKHALGWLGTWDTNFGKVVFTNVFRAKSETPDANGNPQFYWALKGEWHHDHENRQIDGALVERDKYLTMGGCWRAPKHPKQCRKILIGRSGEKLTGGYWRDCPDFCKSHHPWRGTRTKGIFAVGFRFTQHGFPDGHRTFRTETGGAGALLFDDEKAKGPASGASHDSKIFHTDKLPGLADLHISAIAVNGNYGSGDDGSGRRRITLFADVYKSDNSRCPVGSSIRVHATDARGEGPDRIQIEPDTESRCHIRETWTSTDKHRVDVKIDKPQESD